MGTDKTLSIEQVPSALLSKGVAASLYAPDVASGQIRRGLLDPQGEVLPCETWPLKVPTAKVWARGRSSWDATGSLALWSPSRWRSYLQSAEHQFSVRALECARSTKKRGPRVQRSSVPLEADHELGYQEQLPAGHQRGHGPTLPLRAVVSNQPRRS